MRDIQVLLADVWYLFRGSPTLATVYGVSVLSYVLMYSDNTALFLIGLIGCALVVCGLAVMPLIYTQLLFYRRLRFDGHMRVATILAAFIFAFTASTIASVYMLQAEGYTKADPGLISQTLKYVLIVILALIKVFFAIALCVWSFLDDQYRWQLNIAVSVVLNNRSTVLYSVLFVGAVVEIISMLHLVFPLLYVWALRYVLRKPPKRPVKSKSVILRTAEQT